MMSNKGIKRVFLIFIATALFATIGAFAGQTPYCIRIYCQKDVKTKVKYGLLEGGHAMFIPAFLDDATNTFYVRPVTLAVSTTTCPFLSQGNTYWGTSAHLLESIAPWKAVKEASPGQPGTSFPTLNECKALEKK
jgi:hypothetical protein